MQSFQQAYNPDLPNNKPISPTETPPQIDPSPKSPTKPSLSPFLAHTLTISHYEYVCYNQRHNLILAISSDNLKFYDGTTFEKVKTHQLDDWARQISYCDEIDTYIIGCDSGFFYSYNASKDELKKLKKFETDVLRAEFLNAKFYAFILSGENLSIGSLENEDVVNFEWPHFNPSELHKLRNQNLLLSSTNDGSMRVFKTDKIPSQIPGLFTVQAHPGKTIYVLKSYCLKGKEFVITGSSDETLRIWHFLKGKIRLLKVIRTAGKVADSVVYLEDYKMVAVSYENNAINFFKLPFWKLEKTFAFGSYSERHGLFLMKERNMLGCIGDIGFGAKAVDFLKLSGSSP